MPTSPRDKTIGAPTQVKVQAFAPAPKLRILLAEDEEALRCLASKILHRGGYMVTGVENGLQAWELLQEKEFDLLITDIQMPEMNGNELVQKVLDGPRNLPTLMISGYNPEAKVPPGIKFLAKPFTPQQLLEQVAALHQNLEESA